MDSKQQCASETLYLKLYEVLQHGQGKQIALCEKVLKEAVNLYVEMHRHKCEAGLGYSRERDLANLLMIALNALYCCMISTDQAVEDVLLQHDT